MERVVIRLAILAIAFDCLDLVLESVSSCGWSGCGTWCSSEMDGADFSPRPSSSLASRAVMFIVEGIRLSATDFHEGERMTRFYVVTVLY